MYATSVLSEIARQAADAIAARIPAPPPTAPNPLNTPQHDRATAGPSLRRSVPAPSDAMEHTRRSRLLRMADRR